MFTLKQIRDLCFYISTFEFLGKFPGKKILISLIGIPLLFLFMGLSAITNWSLLTIIIVFILLCMITVQFSKQQSNVDYDMFAETPLKMSELLVLDQIIGIMLVFWGHVLYLRNWKLFFLGFAIFHLLNYLKPMLKKIEIFKKIESFPDAIGLFVSDIVFGLLVNIILRIAHFC